MFLHGNATLILSNISGNERGDYAKLVAALSSRFGVTHQSDLARAKLKTQIKRREESLPELAENVETLARKAYPDASTELQDVLARDHYIDALYEEDLRLRIRQARPQSLQVALETALELESFQLATWHRTRMLRGTVGNVKRMNKEIVQNTSQRNERGVNAESKLEELNGLITQLLKVMKAESRGHSLGNRYRRSPEREPGKCWTCGEQDHLAKECKNELPWRPKVNSDSKDGQPRNERWLTHWDEDRPETRKSHEEKRK